jgi:hypothetical protein
LRVCISNAGMGYATLVPSKQIGVLGEDDAIMFQGESDNELVVGVNPSGFLHREHIYAACPQIAGDVEIDEFIR